MRDPPRHRSAMIWTTRPNLDDLDRRHLDTVVAALGIEFTAVGDDHLCARMPVDARTRQPHGILHGGSSVVLAETLGSCAAGHCVDADAFRCVGLDVNANHLRSVESGWVAARAQPVHLGRTTQVWQIEIRDEADRLVCVSRLTMAVLPAAARP
jgi:1,4-dihydroxy-2-naphthoyl-CoA hydrolase